MPARTMWLLDKHVTLLDTALTAVEDRIRMVNASGATVVRSAGFISPRSTITEREVDVDGVAGAGAK